MNSRGIVFLQDWIRQNVTDEDRKGSAIRAMSLADYCIEDAQSVGISASDMEPEWGSIETIIYDAMQSDVDAVLELWKVVAVAHDKKKCRNVTDIVKSLKSEKYDANQLHGPSLKKQLTELIEEAGQQ